MRGPFRSSADTIWVTCAPAIVDFMTSSAVCTPPVTASEACTRPDRMAIPRRRSSSSEESDRCSVRVSGQILHIDVGLIEAVEQHQAIGAFPIELEREDGRTR